MKSLQSPGECDFAPIEDYVLAMLADTMTMARDLRPSSIRKKGIFMLHHAIMMSVAADVFRHPAHVRIVTNMLLSGMIGNLGFYAQIALKPLSPRARLSGAVWYFVWLGPMWASIIAMHAKHNNTLNVTTVLRVMALLGGLWRTAAGCTMVRTSWFRFADSLIAQKTELLCLMSGAY